MKISVPTSWAEVSVRQFIELAKVKDLGFDELDTQLRILSILTGVEDDEFLKFDHAELKKVIQITDFINDQKVEKPTKFKFKIKGQRFDFEYDASKLSAGEYIDIQNYIKNNPNENLHKIIAIYLKPVNFFGFKIKSCYDVNKKGKYIQTLESRAITADLVLDNIMMDQVLSMNGFFLNRWDKLIKATELYLEKLNKKAMKNLEKVLKEEGLSMPTDGI